MDTLIFNHHSLPCRSVEEANRLIRIFLMICLKASNNGLNTILFEANQNIDPNWFHLKLFDQYSFRHWYNKNFTESKDEITAFLKITTKSPFFSKDEYDMILSCDVLFKGNNYTALSAAAWHESPLVSFSTEHWCFSPIIVDVNSLSDDAEQIQASTEQLANIWSKDVLDEVLLKIAQERNKSQCSGKELARSFGNDFSKLVLCDNAKKQLYSWSASLPLLKSVRESLAILNSFTTDWREGVISQYSHEALKTHGLKNDVSGESEHVKTTPKLREKRKFWLPDGRKEFFEDHVKHASGYRLHFFPDCPNKQIYIGYIGTHLPT